MYPSNDSKNTHTNFRKDRSIEKWSKIGGTKKLEDFRSFRSQKGLNSTKKSEI